jgi:hypothetical protein
MIRLTRLADAVTARSFDARVITHRLAMADRTAFGARRGQVEDFVQAFAARAIAAFFAGLIAAGAAT